VGCRAASLCRALPHGKEFFAVRGHKDARHPLTHGIDSEKRTAKKHAWQRARETHGKEKTHGKNTSRRTAKRRSTAKEALRCRGAHFAVRHALVHGKAPFAVRHGTKHGKGAFAVRRVLCRVQKMIFSNFLSILFFLILIFIFSISFIFC
jgi:hypothetical protein